MAKEYFLYCDESVEKGKFYSDFYGGALVESIHYDEVIKCLSEKKVELNFYNEVKWNKVSSTYLEKYMALIDEYFKFIRLGKIKIRIMFRQSAFEATHLTEAQKDNGFFLLYYQFIKRAFGFTNIHKPKSGNKSIYVYFSMSYPIINCAVKSLRVRFMVFNP